MGEKIKTCILRFPARENPNMEKALFDWPIVLQYDVKAKYRMISKKFSGMRSIREYREEKSLRHVAMVAKFLDDNKPKKTDLIHFHLIWRIFFGTLSIVI